jgi:tRNA pseudouridine55 synthase
VDNQDLKNAISGVLVIDKPVGMTSHDVVQAIRIGHGHPPRRPYRDT